MHQMLVHTEKRRCSANTSRTGHNASSQICSASAVLVGVPSVVIICWDQLGKIESWDQQTRWRIMLGFSTAQCAGAKMRKDTIALKWHAIRQSQMEYLSKCTNRQHQTETSKLLLACFCCRRPLLRTLMCRFIPKELTNAQIPE